MRGFDMEKIYHREFNNPKEVSLDIQKKFDKITQAELHFKDTGCEYNLQFNNPIRPRNDVGRKSIQIEWVDFQKDLEVAQISRIVVHKESGLYSIAFWQNHNLTASIQCEDIIGLPQRTK